MTGLAVVAAAAARSLRKYAKHASSCFIQCCVVFVVRRSDVAAGACVFFTLPTSLRRQGGIFRCPKISKKCRSECAHKGWRVVSGVCACAMYAVTITLAKQIVSVCPFGDFNVQFTVGKPVSISLLEQSRFQPDRPTGKQTIREKIDPTVSTVPIARNVEGRFVAVAAGVVAIVVGFQGKSKRKKQQYPSVFEILSFYPLFNVNRRSRRGRARHFYSNKQVAAALVSVSRLLARR
ncbi:myosin-4 [Trichinella spiralis]|uniref:myosin-4 n=1 Tax=Trichinella spiralis TaxID=6334 RepID=UPI0001EFB3F2|nr:myosin-4 [Trichinella spiralis]